MVMESPMKIMSHGFPFRDGGPRRARDCRWITRERTHGAKCGQQQAVGKYFFQSDVVPGEVATPVPQLFSTPLVTQLPSVGEAFHVALAAREEAPVNRTASAVIAEQIISRMSLDTY